MSDPNQSTVETIIVKGETDTVAVLDRLEKDALDINTQLIQLQTNIVHNDKLVHDLLRRVADHAAMLSAAKRTITRKIESGSHPKV